MLGSQGTDANNEQFLHAVVRASFGILTIWSLMQVPDSF
jgi:hypothetical protein